MSPAGALPPSAGAWSYHSPLLDPMKPRTSSGTFAITAALALLTAASLTIAQAESRQWTNRDGKSLTGELKAVNGDQATLLIGGRQFDIAIATLSDADQAFIKEWQATAATQADPAKAYDTPVMKALEGNLLKLEGRRLSDFALASPEKIEVIAFYSSASWCGPCHAFTPNLSRTYESLKKKYDNFELVLLSADDDKGAWEEYVKEYRMPFPVLDHGASREAATLKASRNANFIPSIHILARDGTVLDDASGGASASLRKLEEILKERAQKKDT